MGEKYKFRRGQTDVPVPASEHLGVGEPIYDPDKGALGIGAGEQSPRFYPGVTAEGHLQLLEGQEILSAGDPTTKVGFVNGSFVVTVQGKEVLKVNQNSEAIFDSVTLSDDLKFDQLQTVGYPNVAGFAYKDGVFSISCPLEILGPLNLSLSEFAEGIIPGGYSSGDIFVAGDGNATTHKWQSPDTFLTQLSKFAPLVYRTANNNSRTLDLKFSSIASYFGMNHDKRGVIDDNLTNFLNRFGSNYQRNTVAYYYNSQGKLVSAPINGPRIEYDPFTGRCLGLLIEGASSNLHINSNNLSSYTANNAVATPINRLPWTTRGLRNPSSMSLQGTGEHSLEKQFYNLQPNKPFAKSVYIEIPAENAVSRVQLTLSDGTNTFGSKFRLTNTEAVTSEAVVGGAAVLLNTYISKVSSTLYRIGIAGILNPNVATSVTIRSKISTLNSANIVIYNSSDADVIYLGEIQFEQNDRVSSYIPTGATVLARASDVFALDFGSSFDYATFRNKLGFKFISKMYTVGDPLFTLYSQNSFSMVGSDESSTLSVTHNKNGVVSKVTVGTLDNDFTTYEYDCSDDMDSIMLNVGADRFGSKFFNGWVNLIYLYH